MGEVYLQNDFQIKGLNVISDDKDTFLNIVRNDPPKLRYIRICIKITRGAFLGMNKLFSNRQQTEQDYV